MGGGGWDISGTDLEYIVKLVEPILKFWMDDMDILKKKYS